MRTSLKACRTIISLREGKVNEAADLDLRCNRSSMGIQTPDLVAGLQVTQDFKQSRKDEKAFAGTARPEAISYPAGPRRYRT
jgi:hypothetical protein